MKSCTPSVSVLRSLRKLGADLDLARRRRRLTKALVAERAMISLPTLDKICKGEPNVSLGNYAAVIFALGFGVPFADLIAPEKDNVGLSIEESLLPKRIRLPKSKKDGDKKP